MVATFAMVFSFYCHGAFMCTYILHTVDHWYITTAGCFRFVINAIFDETPQHFHVDSLAVGGIAFLVECAHANFPEISGMTAGGNVGTKLTEAGNAYF